MKKKTVKKLGVLALASMLVLGGSAWLTSRQTAAGVNNIKVGTIGIEFTNQQNEIVLNGNDAIPMTVAYAKDNLTPYTFKVQNTGTIAVEYNLYAKFDEFTFEDQTNGRGPVNLLLNNAEMNIAAIGLPYSNNESGYLDSGVILQPGETKDYTLFAYIDSGTLNDQYLGKTAKFHLELNAKQADGEAPAVATTNLSIPGFDSTAGNITSNPYIKTVQFMYDDQSGTIDKSKYSVEGLPEGFTYEAGEYSLNIKNAVATQTTLTNIRVLYDGVEVEIYDGNGVLISQPLTIDIVKNSWE